MALQHSPLLRAAPLLAAITLPLTGCGFGNSLLGGDSAAASLGQAAAAPTVFGYAVADEPQAALVARQILNDGGNAADAAAAAGFAMAVTLPSRAGLGGGGSCIIKMPGAQGNPQPAVTLIFPPASNSAQGDRPAAAPTMARGLLALQARYGTLPYASVIAPAERLAAGGVPVSPALAADLQVVGNALLADPAARAVFAAPGGGVLPAGANLVQPDLATTLEILRTQDVEGLYKGSFGTQFLAAANQAGGGLTQADLDAALPHYGKPNVSKISGVMVATIPTAAPSANLPASAAFAALDKNGGVVACATTMNNLFGTGRIAPGTGILLAASPRAVPAPLLAAGIAYSGGEFRAAVTGTGQEGAAVAVADGLANALAKTPAAQVPEPGRANIIACPGGVPGGEASCTASADPRGQGLAIGGR